ncbi:MAG: hypothetical protein Q8N16_00415 [bacterium]|nr:hypothetical protein [bacterium]
MNKKTLSIFWVLLSVLGAGIVLLPTEAKAETRFNMMAGDYELLKMKNETQGTASWTDPVSANAGDYVRFNVYYHCGTDGPNIPSQKAQNTTVRLTFPVPAQTTISTSAQISSANVSGASDTGVVNASSAQRLVFDGTAKWYRDNNQTVSDLTVTQGADYAEVNLGELTCDSLNCFTNAGYVIFRGRLSTTLPPTVDLKANGMDGSISINYNTAATLSWTSTNATSCYATDTAWQGNKSTSGSESTGNLLSARTYIITCAGAGGTASDSVTVLVNSPQQALYAALEAIPNTGNAPLNGVDLRATVTGTATGTINYKFDCTSDGTWDHTFYGISDNPKTVVDACNYQNQGSYVAKVRVERGTANPAEATAVVVVGSVSQDVNIVKLARNLSDNTGFAEEATSDPGEVIEFRILVTSTSGSQISNLTVKDTLPEKMSYYGGLKIDGAEVSGNVLTGLDIGSLNPQQTKTVIFQAVVANASNFSYGTTELVNTALVYNTSVARTDTAKVQVTKTEVKGATDVPTGILDSAKLSLLLSGLATLLLTYFLLLRFYVSKKAYAWGINDVLESAKEKVRQSLPKEPAQKSEERLAKMIEKIREKEK